MISNSPSTFQKRKRSQANQEFTKRLIQKDRSPSEYVGSGRLEKTEKKLKNPYEFNQKYHMDPPAGLDPILKQLEIEL